MGRQDARTLLYNIKEQRRAPMNHTREWGCAPTRRLDRVGLPAAFLLYFLGFLQKFRSRHSAVIGQSSTRWWRPSASMLLRAVFIVLTAWSPAVAAAKVSFRPALKTVITLFGAQLRAEQDVLSDVKLSTCTESMLTNSAVYAVHARSSPSSCAVLRRLRGGANSDEEACTLKEPWLKQVKQLPRTVRAIPALLTIAGLYYVLYTTKSGVAGPVGFVLSLSVSIFAIFMLAELSGFDWDPMILVLICLWTMILMIGNLQAVVFAP